MARSRNSLEDRIESNMDALCSVVRPSQLFKDISCYLHDLDRKQLRKELKRNEEVDEFMVYDIIGALQTRTKWAQLLLTAFRKGNQTEALEIIGERTDENLDPQEQREKDSPGHVGEQSPEAHTRPTNMALSQLNGRHGFGEARFPYWSGCESPDTLMQTVKDKNQYPEQSADWHDPRRYQCRSTFDPQLCQGQPVPARTDSAMTTRPVTNSKALTMSQYNFLSSDNEQSLEDNTKEEGGDWNELSSKKPDGPSGDVLTNTGPGDTEEDSAPRPANSEQRDTERPEDPQRPLTLSEALFQGNRTSFVHNGPLIMNISYIRNLEIATQTSQSSCSTFDRDSAPHDESFQSIDVQSAQQTPTEFSDETSQKMPIETTTEMSPVEEQTFDRLTERSESFELGDTSSVREVIANRPVSSPSGTTPYSPQPGAHTQLMLLKSFDEATISERTFPATEPPSESDLPSSSILILRGADTSSCVAGSSQSSSVSQHGFSADNQHVDTNSIQCHGSPSSHSDALQQVPMTEVCDRESFTESTFILPVPVQEDDRRSSPVIHLLQPGYEDLNVHLLNAEVEAEQPSLEGFQPSDVADEDNLEPKTFKSKCGSNREWSGSSVLNLIRRGQENQLLEAEQNKQYDELSEDYLPTGLQNATVSVETASPVKGHETSVHTSKTKGPIKNTKKSKRRKKSRK